LLVEVKNTAGRRGLVRAASSTFNVPRAFTSKSRAGSSKLVVTATCAAK